MRLACVGDVGTDNYTNLGLRKPGGIAFNVAYNASVCGLAVSVVTAIGTDPEGDTLAQLLPTLGVDVSAVRRLAGRTARQDIRVEPDGERRFAGYDKGVLTDWRLSPDDLAFIAGHDAVFVPLTDGTEDVFAAVARIPGPALKAADFSIDYEFADYDRPDNALARNCHAFRVNFFGGRRDHLPMVEALAGRHPDRLFVLTLGAGGAVALSQGMRFSEPAPSINRVVDTTGCGDAFQAAFLATFLRTHDIPSSLRAGTARAAIVLSHLGATTLTLPSAASGNPLSGEPG
jgi:fructoselysine 6-kinase